MSIRTGAALVVDNLPVLFAGDSWTAYRDGEDVVLAWRAVGDGGLLWLARLDSSRRRVDVRCGPQLVLAQGDELSLRNPLSYPLDQLLLNFVLAGSRGLVVHAAGIASDGAAAVFAGRSGAGKTTLMRALAPRTDLCRLSDDRVCLRREGDQLTVYGTPWPGEGRVANNARARLAALVFLHQAPDAPGEELRPIAPPSALEQLLPTSSILWFESDHTSGALAFCERVVNSVPAYDLYFRRQADSDGWLDQLLPA